MARWTKANQEALNRVVEATQAGNPGYVFLTVAEGNPLEKAGLAESNAEIKDAEGRIAFRATEDGISASDLTPDENATTVPTIETTSTEGNGNMSETATTAPVMPGAETGATTGASEGATAPAAVTATVGGEAEKPKRKRGPNPPPIDPASIVVSTASALPTKAEAEARGRKSFYPFDKLEAPVANNAGGFNYSRFFVPATVERPDAKKFLTGTVNAANRKLAKEAGEGGSPVKYEVHAGEENGVAGAHVYRVA